MGEAAEQSLLCVMPRTRTEWAGAAAMWITAAGWAAAGRRRFGQGWVLTPGAVDTAEAVLGFTEPTGAGGSDHGGVKGRVPEVVKTGVKDVRRLLAAERYRRGPLHGPWELTDVRLVWQHHDLWHRTGEVLARRLERPLVSFVHAPQVWEAARWGVRRPGWGGLVERFGERPGLRHSDVVACVSDEVAAQLQRLGVAEERLVVAPMAVDADRFSPEVSGAAVRRRFGLDDAFVIGWTGSFRRFHGLEIALAAFAAAHAAQPAARLLLVGDGPERAALERQAVELGLGDAVVFSGAVGHLDMPAVVAAMDATVVVARPGEGFHYSPLKMREYMACAKPVLAPAVGEITSVIEDGVSGLLYEAGDTDALAAGLLGLVQDPARCEQLGAAARDWVVREGTWDVQLDRVLRALGRLGLDGVS